MSRKVYFIFNMLPVFIDRREIQTQFKGIFFRKVAYTMYDVL